MGLIEQEIEAMIQREVARRVKAELKRRMPGMIEPIPVPAPSEDMPVWGGGDAGQASGEFFSLRVSPDRKHIEIYCPTFLRGRLGMLNIEFKGASY